MKPSTAATSPRSSTPSLTTWTGPRRPPRPPPPGTACATAKDAVAAFFTAFGSAMEIEEFTPASFAANDTDVLAAVRCRARSRSTGKTLAMDLHHYFRFRDGKIAYYRGTEDTAQTEAALRG
ncbi:MAG: nuclear transport factor 2 family protein [Streptosporangiaceae bacterium]